MKNLLSMVALACSALPFSTGLDVPGELAQSAQVVAALATANTSISASLDGACTETVHCNGALFSGEFSQCNFTGTMWGGFFRCVQGDLHEFCLCASVYEPCWGNCNTRYAGKPTCISACETQQAIYHAYFDATVLMMCREAMDIIKAGPDCATVNANLMAHHTQYQEYFAELVNNYDDAIAAIDAQAANNCQ